MKNALMKLGSFFLKYEKAMVAMLAIGVMALMPQYSMAIELSQVVPWLQRGLGAWIIKTLLVVAFITHFFVQVFMKFWKGDEGIGGAALQSVLLLGIIMAYDTIMQAIASAISESA